MNGIELYFPPLRALRGAAALGGFGVVCVALPIAALFGLVAASGSHAHSMLAIVLTGAFIVPLAVFGAVFVALAVYLAANSLTVNVGTAKITTLRRVFGLPLARRAMRCGEIAAIEPRPAARYESLFSAEPCYGLIARNNVHRSEMVVAEGLCGEALAIRVGSLIASAAGVEIAGFRTS